MIVKILSSSAKFSGVVYNTSKIDRNKGELMRVANFGSLEGLSRLRPQDYINYFQMIASQNTRIKKPQFHAVLSAKGRNYSSKELTEIAVSWLDKMGYGKQPYLIVYHKDTDNNHVHVVSVRVDKQGKKINSAYEKLRAIGNLKEVLGIDKALGYRFSTRAQFFMVMESLALPGKEVDEKTIHERINNYERPAQRIAELRELFRQLKHRPDFKDFLSNTYQVEVLFHSAEGKQPYGYSIIDHSQKMVFKGSEVLPLKELLGENMQSLLATPMKAELEESDNAIASTIRPVWIADDVDDQQIHGMRRRRQKKARTNTR
ncbi:relaxase/mobilization nuclease domain-containing protein [Mucilaginibacter sp. OK098]|uniref:relaxase/mobilization nuclease domain-containing protein n=1 Tax=Mucilaginibacter sp. OK098 TaxID=1855297 RepID=UPI00091C7F68|nr:relaxase/mobilization nuclease domain-containing protein [Mucilaginibacter sp. OK098]SHM93001.1 Relaxase/Mobilisation nuclease domain-containing protein [Mucilaginibacter sp. OK098]